MRRPSGATPEQRFNQLYRDTSDDVLAYLVRRSPTLEDATDAFAETYVAAWRKLETLPDGDRARLWLFGAARIELRKAASQTNAAHKLAVRLANELETASPQQATSANVETDTVISQAVALLSAKDREILALTAWEGLTPREIAVVMGVSGNAVRLRLSRARRSLRGHLQREQSSQAPTARATSEPNG